jgi:hypothetical protein
MQSNNNVNQKAARISGAEGGASLRINGALLAVARRPSLTDFDAALRGVALSDSPVLVRAAREEDRTHIAGRLHALGRRRDLPLHGARTVAEARALIVSRASGTWALHDVASWSEADQVALARLLALFDEHRLHGNLSHEQIPRVVVIEGEKDAQFCEELAGRLAFFDITIA